MDARRLHRPFPVVWPVAVAATLATVDDPAERSVWTAVLDDTRATWEAAYGGDAAPPAELALVVIAEDPDRCVPIAEAGAGGCAHCGGPIGAHKRPTARYCCRVCQRATHGRRAAA